MLIVSGNITGNTQTLPIYIYDAWDQRFDVLGSYSGALVLALDLDRWCSSCWRCLRRSERRLRVDLA